MHPPLGNRFGPDPNLRGQCQNPLIIAQHEIQDGGQKLRAFEIDNQRGQTGPRLVKECPQQIGIRCQPGNSLQRQGFGSFPLV